MLRRLVAIPAMFAMLGCGLAALLPTRLPEARPPDFAVVIMSSGGMVPYSSRSACSAEGCSVEVTDHGQTTQRSAPVTAAQLDALYAAVRAHRFDRIQMEQHGIIYDAGGTNVLVTAAGQTYSFGASATSSVAKPSQADFQAVIAAQGALIAELGLRGK